LIVFWIAALAMLAVALAFVIPPIAVARGSRGPSRADVQRAMYQEQLQELNAQRDAGSLDPESFREAREELDRDFLDQQSNETATPTGTTAYPYRAAIVAVLIPAAATGMYLAAGTPSALLDEAPQQARPSERPHAGGESAPPIEDMVATLEQRLTREPGDAQGWAMLARSYQVMNRPDDARRVLGQALGHHPDNPALLVNLAEVLATGNGNRLDGKPMEYVRRALEIQPDFPRALWLAGIHALNQGDPQAAVESWERVLRVAKLEPGARAQIEDAIADARQRAAGTPAPATATSTAAEAGSVEVTVTLADALVQHIQGNETLFVFARASTGPPMPLAVKRLTSSALPVTVVLDDSSAMAPELRLSQFDPVVVTARISRSGTPTATSGDLQGVSAAVSPGDSPETTVIIDQVVE
jgi:cytochrome c-type biogenesis protein CcmH